MISKKMAVRGKNAVEKLCEVIPGGVNSPARSFPDVEQTPMVVDFAHEDMIFDVDGKPFLDFCCSWGALILGHVHMGVVEAVTKRLSRGSSFGISTEIEEKIARKLVSLVDSVEKVRFVNSGTEATMSAARLARGATGRDLIVKFTGNYHGHADFFLVQAGSGVMSLNATSSSAGVPDDIVKHTACLPYNDVEALRSFFKERGKEVAAVIVEPVAGNMGVIPGDQEFIQALREETLKNGALLIFDEVITGFRVGLKGAQGLYGITPDLTCFGKVIGGGFPVAAFGGRADVMDHLAPLGQVYQAGTLSGNPVAMEAGYETLKHIEKPGFYDELDRKTKSLVVPVRRVIKELNLAACIQRRGSMFTLFFGKKRVRNMEDAKQLDTALFSKYFSFMYERGIYVPPSQFEACFISSVHTQEHLDFTRDAMIEFLRSL
ncbi:MAG: glutamate-1-semialdehyde-2,1-aminomutase [Waddliaceae bacterium]|nr:glutamate-1-semialdehyde-2,1-aminomutase [Waddliaceae bacterium]